MTPAELLTFMRGPMYAVQSSVHADGAPQSAVVGIVVSDHFEVFFDTLEGSRKALNLRRQAGISFVIGGTLVGDERTVQYEGVADEPQGADLERLQALYFARFPDGVDRQRLPGCIYFRARPAWIRYSDYGRNPPEIAEFTAADLRSLGI